MDKEKSERIQRNLNDRFRRTGIWRRYPDNSGIQALGEIGHAGGRREGHALRTIQ